MLFRFRNKETKYLGCNFSVRFEIGKLTWSRIGRGWGSGLPRLPGLRGLLGMFCSQWKIGTSLQVNWRNVFFSWLRVCFEGIESKRIALLECGDLFFVFKPIGADHQQIGLEYRDGF